MLALPSLALAYARLIAIIVGAVGLAYAWITVQGWRDDSHQLARVEAESAEKIAHLQRAYAAVLNASRGYQHELEVIRARPVRAAPVRLCVEPRAVAPVSRAAAVDPGFGRPVPAAELVPDATRPDFAAGPDIGPELTALLRRADEVSAQGRALQEYCHGR